MERQKENTEEQRSELGDKVRINNKFKHNPRRREQRIARGNI